MTLFKVEIQAINSLEHMECPQARFLGMESSSVSQYLSLQMLHSGVSVKEKARARSKDVIINFFFVV